jgi:OPA family glycerol-3-phosphate transporter-like MFS transporter
MTVSMSPQAGSGELAVPTSTDDAPRHSRAFRVRRASNWIPLGVMYAAFYMGRYNFNVIKGDLGKFYHLDKAQIGAIATAGFWTYALSVMVNGPLADRIGGRRSILVGALGVVVMNAVIGVLFLRGFSTHLVLGMSFLYAANMYFQSFGAVSVVKINAAWFHVRERGMLGGVFAVLIGLGYWLAFTLGGKIFALSKARWPGSPWAFAPIFVVPAFATLVMFLVLFLRVRDKPSHAGHEDLNTGDASAGDEAPADLKYVFRKVFMHPVIRVVMGAEFCTGFVRQGLLLYMTEFLVEVHHQPIGNGVHAWTGNAITIGGIVGGIGCGLLSDKIFQSRRPPVAFLFYVGQIISLVLLSWVSTPLAASFMIGVSCMFIFGVHGMLSGTASADFGGKKAAASAAGILDGVQYVASGLTGFGLGWFIKDHWERWTWALVPFSAIGAVLMLFVWNAKPGRSAH